MKIKHTARWRKAYEILPSRTEREADQGTVPHSRPIIALNVLQYFFSLPQISSRTLGNRDAISDKAAILDRFEAKTGRIVCLQFEDWSFQTDKSIIYDRQII